MTKIDKNNGKVDVQVFSKERLLKAEKFKHKKDVLGVVVKDGEEISTEEATARIEKFMKEKVN